MPTTETKTMPADPVGPPRHRTDDLLSKLADRIGAAYGASTVFGLPVERDGVTVVPVAVVRFGFGGGAGGDSTSDQDGEGAGAGGMVTPAGYIELKDGRSRFVPIVHPTRMLALVAGAILTGLLITRPVIGGKSAPRLGWK